MEVPDLPEALTSRVAFLLRLALARAETMGEEALTALGISGREYGILALLEDGPAATQQQLGAALGVDRTTTVALTAGLQDRGLISRAPDPGNRRAHQVALTEAGEALRARAAAVLTDCDERYLGPLPGDQRDHLRSLLRQLL